ncbi:Putative NAD-dependent epimerase/dehydratase, NAD(P)-binding domain superfamily [Colletotrichum destructivum]|uniref:NAD-dependent epimerase/dehydratase, NAD(P)-binding domain superfamily n=1 Tax=Colletotrichum destructivum TaxID=34406 RepID=A0AAX4I0J9_9PEZI|nr:Putative NAD-dependent epimerase/dehydratase, NAD(P)-binding domain superfamily [Colletotrichum destructivum]
MLCILPDELLLITGVTGHVGFAVLIHALRAGHTVRCAVRSEAKAAFIRSRPQIKALDLPRARLNFAIVPDITTDGAYDEAIRGVSSVIHVASPLATADSVPRELHQEYFIQPAVRGTLGMLEAARRAGTVRRVVITSSIVALASVDQLEGRERRQTAVQPTERAGFRPEPYESEFAAYAASKVAALKGAEAWIARERPAFEVVHLHPSFVIGRNDIATTTTEAMRGTNAVILATLRGKKMGCNYAGATVHVDDVARAHVQALTPAVPGNRSYILSTRARWNDAKLIAKRGFPEAVERKLICSSGSVGTVNIEFDASETERVFGFRLQGFEEQVRSVVAHYVELRLRRPALSSMGSSMAMNQPLRPEIAAV